MTEGLATLERGRTLASRYRLVRRLGRGGMASVWLAIDDALGRSVAVKVIAEALAADPEFATRFRREVRAVAALSHPNIVRIFDSGCEREREFFVMEYVPGGTLADRLARAPDGGSHPDARRLARELLAAAGHIHDAGVVHRDIKPSNVLLARDGSPRLTDFGIAYAPEATRLTSTGVVIGSARYLAPEVLAGEPATPRSDLYSLGRLLEELPSAEPDSTSLARLIRALTRVEPASRPRNASDALELLDGGETTRTRALGSRAPRRPARAKTTAPARTTRVDPRPRAASRAPSRISRRARPARKQRTRGARAATASVLVLLAALVLLISLSSGGSAPPRARSPARATPSSQGASLQSELDAIGQRISRAANR